MDRSRESETPDNATDAASSLPLCLDLDGTLLRTDMLHETAFAALRANPVLIFRLPGWLAAGRPRLKRELASRAEFDPAHLPYDEDLLAYARDQRERGRKIVLATASHRLVADRIAGHLDLFDEVLATDEEGNLKADAKAAKLVERFGRKGFAYAGDAEADLPVWREAGAALLVRAAPGLKRKLPADVPVEREFGRRPPLIPTLARAARIHQWAKSFLVFVPAIAAGALLDAAVLRPTLMMFVGFCLTASGGYILNDALDLEADRKHPRKRRRPFASADLSLAWSWLGPALYVAGLATGFYISVTCGALLTLYAVLTSAYSLRLKRMALVDAFVLAGLYSLRLLAGGFASGYVPTDWLLAFSSFAFLSLAFLKRSSEITTTTEGTETAAVAGRGYVASDLTVLTTMGIASSFVSCLVLALWVDNSEWAPRLYRQPKVMWGMVPLLLFWQCRMWLTATRGQMHDDPVVHALRDRATWIVLVALMVVFFIARRGLGGL